MSVSPVGDNEEVKRENIFSFAFFENWKLIVFRERVILINYTRQGGTGEFKSRI